MKRVFNAAIIPLIISGFVVLGWWLLKDATIDVLQPQGQIASQQRDLLYGTVALSLIVILPVFFMLGFFAWKFRESNKQAVYTPEWDHSNRLEAIWWGIPVVVVVFLAVITWQTSHSLDPYRPIVSDKKTIEVQVVALQWKWLFIYPELGVATVNKLPVPVDVPIHFTLTADAPMSAFWVPSLGSQIYTMNGMSSQLNLIANNIGDYNGYSTNINGAGYSDMKFIVHSINQNDFDTWVKSTSSSKNMLDEVEYKKLAEKSIEKNSKEYMLHDKDLYDKIVSKYMNHTNDSNHNTDNTHDMEGM